MVHLVPPVAQNPAMKSSSSYYDKLKKSGRLKSDIPIRNKTASYDKHFLRHTDTTGGGLGNSYPHNKDFAWNLLFLKQSWGSNLNAPKNKPSPAGSSSSVASSNVSSRSTSRSEKNGTSALSRRDEKSSLSRKVHTAPELTLPPLQSKSSSSNKLSSSSKSRGFIEKKRRTAELERSRMTLDSIPENEPLKSSKSRTLAAEERSTHRLSISSRTNDSRRSRLSRKSESRASRLTASSSVLSTRLPSAVSGADSDTRTSTVMTSRSYVDASRMSGVTSRSTRWDEHEGRPAAEKLLARKRDNNRPNDSVPNTIKPEVLKSLVRAVSEQLNTRRSYTKHLESPQMFKTLEAGGYTVKKHQPFTNLKFAVENSANQTRLRSSLYKTEEAQRRPTIFRSNLTEAAKQKDFNPRYHGEITRPFMVDHFAHKHPVEGHYPPKWTPKLNGLNGSKYNGPWTTYTTS